MGILVTYVSRSQQQERLAHLRLPMPLHKPHTMTYGPRAPQHLDLLPVADGTPNLFTLINRTRSSLGARQLRRWILEPLRVPAEITFRQDGVRALASTALHVDKISESLAGLYDLERICGRVNARLANPRDTLALGRSLALLPALVHLLAGSEVPAIVGLRSVLTDSAAALGDLSARIIKTQLEEAPLTVREGGIFALGTTRP